MPMLHADTYQQLVSIWGMFMGNADSARLTELLSGMSQDDLKEAFGDVKSFLEDKGLGSVVRQVTSTTDISQNQLDAEFYESEIGQDLTNLVHTVALRPVLYGSVDKDSGKLRVNISVELVNEDAITQAANKLRASVKASESNPLGQRFTAIGDKFSPEVSGDVLTYQDVTANKVAPKRAAIMTEFKKGKGRTV